MKVKLIIVSPEVQPNEYDVTLPTRIGRGHEAKLKLVHPLVSRLHCELFAAGEQVMIRDLDSLNGTFVDQQRVDEDTPVASGATVMIGTVMFRLAYGKEANRLPAAAAKMDKTVAAAGTVRQDSLAKISKGQSAVNDEELWAENVEDLTVVDGPAEEPLGLALLDDEPNQKTPKPAGAAKPGQPAVKQGQPPAKPKATAPAKNTPAPAPAKAPARPTPAAPPPPAKAAPARPAAPSTPPAKPARAAPAKGANKDDPKKSPLNQTAADAAGSAGSGGEDDDVDDFLKSIM